MHRALAFAVVCAVSGLLWAQPVTVHKEVIGKTLSSSGRFGVMWETPRSVWAPKTASPPKVDAVLDDACWNAAAVLTGFIAGSQNAERPYSERVLLCYDDKNLYLGCSFGEPQPARIRAAVRGHDDVEIWTDDAVEVHVQVDMKKVMGAGESPCWVQFITNTLGMRFAQVCFRGPRAMSQRPRPWSDKWQAAGRVAADAWFSEIAIPWSLLQIEPAEGASIRMNIFRSRNREPETWNMLGMHNPERFGVVHLGRGGQGGLEVRQAGVACAGETWTLAADVVAAGNRPVQAELRATVKQKDEKVLEMRSAPARVGAEPLRLETTATVARDGAYTVEVELLADGEVTARGKAFAERKPLVERLFLFRRDYDTGEELIRGYYRLTALPPGAPLRAQLTLSQNGRDLAEARIEPVTSAEGQFDFRVPPLADGKPVFRARLLQGTRALAEIERELTVRRPAPVERGRAPFQVAPAGVELKAWPITCGVPFGRGMLAVKDVEKHTRVLDAAGRELPCQSRVLATWTDARLDAQWVLFDFLGDLAADRPTDFSIEFGVAVQRADAGKALAEQDADGAISVAAGPLSAKFSAQEPVFFANMQVNGKPVTARSKGGELYLKLADPARIAALLPHQHEYRLDRSSRTLLAELCAKDYALELEHNGPIRAVVKATGWYGDKEGNRLFKYLLRLYFHRGRSHVTAFHTWIATEPEQYVYSAGLNLQVAGRTTRTAFGGDAGQPVVMDMPGSVVERALFQPSAEYFRVMDHAGTTPDWGVQRASGRRASGWCDVDLTGQAILLAVKDFWQEFPKGFSVQREGELGLAFVGGRGPHHLDLRSGPYTKEEQATGNSQGVAKTTRFVLDFHAPNETPEALAMRGRAALTDLAVWIAPEWIQEADPLWLPVTRCTPDSPDLLKRAYANHVAMYAPFQPQTPEVVHGLPLYGLLNYGDRVHDMSTRGWFNNEDYYLPFKEWVAWMSTGDLRVLEGVRAFVRHLIDVDTLNYTTRDPGEVGLQSRHRRIHWGQPAIVTHTYVDQSLLYYYLYGYERGADHAELIRQGQRVWAWWPARGWYSRENPSGAACRDYGVNLRILMNAYRHCWDPALLVRAHELWSRYAEGFTPDGSHLGGYFNVPRGVELYARYTGDPVALEAVKNTDVPCPALAAELGRPEKMQRALAEVERELSNAHERLETPWWELQHPNYSEDILGVHLFGWAERAARRGEAVKPVRGGELRFWGDMDIVFLEEEDREHDLEVKIWKSDDPPKSEAILYGPDGKEVFNKPFTTRELPFLTHGNVLSLKVPKDGRTGHYLLRLKGLNGSYMSSCLSKGLAKRVYLVTPDKFSLGAFSGTRFWFWLPAEVQEFRIGASPGNRAHRFGFAVYDPQYRLAAAKGWYYNSQLDQPVNQWVEVKAPPDARGQWWSLAYTCRKDMFFTWPKELPSYLADSAESGFRPDPEYLKLVPQPKPAGK